jgi:hypothetical protein
MDISLIFQAIQVAPLSNFGVMYVIYYSLAAGQYP